MAIRIRTNGGVPTCAACAAMTEPKPGDIYLDDAAHHVLATKFMRDFEAEGLIRGSAPIDAKVAANAEVEESEPSPALAWWKATYDAPTPNRMTCTCDLHSRRWDIETGKCAACGGRGQPWGAAR